MRNCTKCGVPKTAAEFQKNASKPDGLHSYCKPCANTARAESRKRNGRPPNKRAYNLATRYGITEGHEASMLAAQAGGCAICTKPLARHHVDHDHATGAVRGLLCPACNLGVGHLERPGFLPAALAYLKKHGGAA
jgi:hypothetical protein